MEEFINSLNTARFERTNALWNNLMLNDPWSIGYVTTLIETREFVNKEDWENYYYKSGEERNTELLLLNLGTREMLNHEQLVVEDKAKLTALDWSLKNLNFTYGRTKEQLIKKGLLLFNHSIKLKIDIKEEECIEAVRFRTICQTWNGVVIRERKTINLLSALLPGIKFQKTNGDFDYEFAVDYELYTKEKLICGIQIKPSSYDKSNALYVRNAKAANKRKNSAYSEKYKAPVFDVFFEKGQILNSEVLDQIKKLILSTN